MPDWQCRVYPRGVNEAGEFIEGGKPPAFPVADVLVHTDLAGRTPRPLLGILPGLPDEPRLPIEERRTTKHRGERVVTAKRSDQSHRSQHWGQQSR